MLWSLLDGKARPAGELAFVANVSPQSASLHLSKLIAAKMLSVTSLGRHRYYSIASAEVAHVVESMASLTGGEPKTPPAPRAETPDFRIARTCYDHLAGKVAIELAGSLLKQKIIKLSDQDFTITKTGNSWFGDFGIDVDGLKQDRRALAKKCLDWSERQHHIAGSLGKALLNEMLRRKWLTLRSERVVGITVQGRKEMNRLFGIVV